MPSYHDNEIQHIIRSLGSEKAKAQAERIANELNTSEEKKYFIRNIREIDDPTTFFEILSRTGAIISFVCDGIVVSPGKTSEIKLHPKAYNTIGKCTGKITEIERNRIPIELLAVYKKYIKKMKTEEQKKNFNNELKNILNQPSENHVEAVIHLLHGEQYSGFGLNNITRTEIETIMKEGLKEVLSKSIQISNLPNDIKETFNHFSELKTQKLRKLLANEDHKKLKELQRKCEVHRKEYFFKINVAHARDISYIKESNRLEIELCGGKNLEEWECEKKRLDSQFVMREISGNIYNKQSQEVDEKIKQAKEFRKYKIVMDIQVLSGEGSDRNIRNMFEKVYPNTNRSDLNSIQQRINENSVFQEVKHCIAQYTKDISIFWGAQMERFTYAIHTEQIQNIFQSVFKAHIFDIMVNNRALFKNMNIEEYDRFSRVFREYKDLPTIEILKVVKQLASDTEFLPSSDILNSADIASMLVAIAVYMVSFLVSTSCLFSNIIWL